MNWGSPVEFFHMGGYALYVWGSYGVTLLVFVVELVLLRHRRRTLLRRLGRMAEMRTEIDYEA